MKKFITLFIIHCSLFIGAAHAAVDAALVRKAEQYLNAITGLDGRFSQVANDRTDRGTFSMLRPGRVRLDYSTLPVQLISNGRDLFFFDRSLDQITTVPLTSTPAGILVRRNINLTNADIAVSETISNRDFFSLKMHIKGQEGVGHMVVDFTQNPVALRSWTVVDATGLEVKVEFENMRVRTDFPRNFFELQRHRTTAEPTGDRFFD